MHDKINKPKHYNLSKTQCIEVNRHMPYGIGNVFKYLYRSKDKDTFLENLKKAEWYLNDYIENFPNGLPDEIELPEHLPYAVKEIMWDLVFFEEGAAVNLETTLDNLRKVIQEHE